MTDTIGRPMFVGDLIAYAAASHHRGRMRIGVITKHHPKKSSYSEERITTKFFEQTGSGWRVGTGVPQTTECMILDIDELQDEELKDLIQKTQASIV